MIERECVRERERESESARVERERELTNPRPPCVRSQKNPMIERVKKSGVGPLFLNRESVKTHSTTLLHRRIIGTRQFKGLRTQVRFTS